MHNIRTEPPDDRTQLAHRPRADLLTGVLQFNHADVHSDQPRAQAAPERQGDRNGEFAPVKVPQNIQQLDPRAADIAVGDDI